MVVPNVKDPQLSRLARDVQRYPIVTELGERLEAIGRGLVRGAQYAKQTQRCPFCGERLPDRDAVVCDFCGADLVSPCGCG